MQRSKKSVKFLVIKVIWLAVNGIKFVIWNQLKGVSFVQEETDLAPIFFFFYPGV